MKKLICKRCGHTWFPRIDRKPRACPGCKSYTWDEDRENSPNHHEYERRKNEIQNLNLSPDQYEAEILKLSNELGI